MRKLAGLTILIMVLPVATAYSAELVTVDQQASPEDPAEFRIDIFDVQETATFRATLSGPHQQRFYVDGATKIEEGRTGNITILVNPEQNAIQQRYGFTVFLRPVTAEEFTEFSGSYYVQRSSDLRIIGVEMPKNVDPGQNFTATGTVRSISGTTVDNYSLELELFNQTSTASSSPIIPGGERELEFRFSAPEQGFGDYSARFRLMVDGENQQNLKRTIKVNKLRRLERDTETENGFFQSTKTSVVENTGNVAVNTSLNQSVASYLSPLTSSSVEPDSEEQTSGSSIYLWNVELAPGESFTVTTTTNYWAPILMAFLGIAAVYGVRKLSSDLQVSKDAEAVEGELKISITVENTSRAVKEQIMVKEFVPDVADVIREFQMAKPRIRKTSDGTELEWSIDDLQPGETAILQYRVMPKVEVEGGITLQPAKVYVKGASVGETDRKTVEFRPE